MIRSIGWSFICAGFIGLASAALKAGLPYAALILGGAAILSACECCKEN
jgi:hypothetical protein